MRGGLVAASALLGGLVAILMGVGCALTEPAVEADARATAAQRAAARTYLAALDPLPDDWRAGTFEPEDGVVLETGFLPARGERRGTAVFVPGYTAPLELYAAELRRLAEGGWDVAALSQRGQGRSTRSGAAPDMGHVEDYADLTRDLAAFVAAQEGPVAVVAISMGGHVALRMAAERAPDVAAYVAVVPMVRIRTGAFPGWVARGMAEVMDRTGLAGRYAPGTGPWDRADLFEDAERVGKDTICSDTPERAHLRDALFTLDPALRVDAPSMGWIAATLRSQSVLRRTAPLTEAPVLMITAGRDRIVSTPAAARLCDAMATCERLHAPDAPHCLLEGDRTRAAATMEAILAYLDREVGDEMGDGG